MVQAPDGSIEQMQPAERLSPAEHTVGSSRPLRILHLIVTVGHSNAQYNEHCLPMRFERDITICAFNPATLDVPAELTVFEGDGTARGFSRALGRALDAREYDIVQAHAPGTAALLLLHGMLHRRAMSDAVLTVHNTRTSFPLKNQGLLMPLFASFPTVVFCSRSAFESFPRRVRDLRGGMVAIVPNGVDMARVTAAIEGIDRPDPVFRVVAVGRLIARKDPITLLRAFRLACSEDDELRYVGDGAQHSRLLREAARSGLGSRVEVTGSVERDDVYRHISHSSVYVSTSHGEGLPVAVLEAMACGRPVVLSDIAPHREIAGAADAVRLVAPGDALGFAREIRRLREMSPDARAEIGQRCRALVEERFDLETMHRSYERVYERVISRDRDAASLQANRKESVS